jgi:hypothetical protein
LRSSLLSDRTRLLWLGTQRWKAWACGPRMQDCIKSRKSRQVLRKED